MRRRLGPDALARLVADYEAGASSNELMVRYQLGKSTVLGLLREHGVVMRPHCLSEQTIDEAIRLYQDGLSAAQVGQQLGCTADTVRKYLRQRNVAMRDSRFGVKRPRKSRLE